VDPSGLMEKFQSALPVVRKWIDGVLEDHREQASPVINLGFHKLQKVFPLELLEKARVVIVTGRVPFPPLSRMGLHELSEMEDMPAAGITYKDTFFINRTHQSENVHFHELVHVVQWERLGVDRFLLAYGAGLIEFGYRESPLEEMAYSLERSFSRGDPPGNIVHFIGQKTDEIWNGVAPMVGRT
jgi:hypothetical protein